MGPSGRLSASATPPAPARSLPMYLPSHFEQTNVEELHRLIAEHPLGMLVLKSPQGLDANHLPFEVLADAGERGTLIAHVARANPLWKETRDSDEALVVFRGAEAYVSPSWYPSKHELHRQVPTWNYLAVHVHGRIAIRDDERFVRGVVARLTRRHEARANPEKPWKMTDSAPDYVDAMLKNIVGIEIPIDRIVGKWKLSQNKDERDRTSAAEELRKRDEAAMSAAMLGAIGERK